MIEQALNSDWLEDHPDYVPLLKRMLEYEKENKCPDSPFIEDTEYDTCWEYTDVKVNPTKLHHLNTNGFVEKVFSSNSKKAYCLTDRDAVEDLLTNDVPDNSDDIEKELHDFPDEEELPDGVFDDVIGYEDAKWLLKRGMTTDEITNFLLVGPPGSAKTVFLLCIQELENASFIPASSASDAGFHEVMFNETPKYVLLDELDDMDKEDQKALSSYTETGLIKETKYGKTRELKTNSKTFATANDTDQILGFIEDRFLVLNFDEYEKDEYIEVCEHVLPDKTDSTKEESRLIAELLWEQEQTGDVRKAITVGRLSRGDPEKVISVLDEYSESSLEQFR